MSDFTRRSGRVAELRAGSIGFRNEDRGQFENEAWVFSPPATNPRATWLRQGWALGRDYALASANLTVETGDGITRIYATTGASDRTITLPPAALNAGRPLFVYKMDSAVGKITIDGAASETIDGNLTVGIWYQRNWLELLCTGTEWLIIGAPMVLRPANPVEVVGNYNPGSTPTTYNVSFSAYVPAGTKAVYVDSYCQSTTAGHYFQFLKTGVTWLGQDIQVANQNIHLAGIVPLDASLTLDTWFSNAAISGFYLELLGYWL